MVLLRARTVGSSGRLAGAVVAALVAATLATGAPAYADDPVPGGQSAGDSLFPHQGNTGYDVQHYDVNLKVDVAVSSTNNAVATTTFPEASTAIQAVTTGAPLSSFSFDFQGSSGNLAASTLTVDSVIVDGTPASFSRIENTTVSSAVTDNHKLIVTPATPVNGPFTTVVTYHGTPVRHADTDGSSEGWNNTTDGATFLNQPVGAMTAFPNNDTPRDKATYTFTVDVPSVLGTSNASVGGNLHASAVASNGELVSKTPSGDGSRTTWVWAETKPMASELSLISVGRYDVHESDVTLNSGRTLHEWTFIDPAISTQSQLTTQTTRGLWKPILDFYETKYGPYPGNSIGYVTDIVPSAINYALETQDRSFFPNSAARGTAIHEVMHQWFGDDESPVDWNDIWLNEGPATYAETQVPFEALGATPTNPSSTETNLYGSWNSTAGTSSLWSSATVASMTQASQLFGNPTYTRGSMTLAALRTVIGDVAFETVMKQWQSRYGGQSHRTADFIDLAEEISGRDLTAFFNTWIYTTGKPAWPAKFNLSLTGPSAPVLPGLPAAYTLTSRNTGKVAQTGSVVSVDLSDALDDATVVSLPTDSSLAGNTLTWNVPSTAVGASSTATLTLLVDPEALGSTLNATATATTLGGTCIDCTPSVVVGALPILPAPAPGVTGTATVGLPLTATTAGWPGGTSFSYQWLVDDTPVPGATSSSYTPGVYDLGLPVKVVVTGTLAGSAPTSATSAATAAVVRGTFTSSPTPTVVGTPQLGVPLSAATGAWDPGTALTYQWAANGTTVSAANGGTGPTFTPSLAAQLGQAITVTVTGTKAGYTTVSRTSAATGGVASGAPLALTPTPTVIGTPQVGLPLTTVRGQWDDGVALTYQWAANGTNIGGATAVAFTPTAAQLGAALTVTVTGTKPGIAPVSRTSAVSAPVDPGTQALQPTPSITGTPRANTASIGVQGTWDTGTTKTNKWYADGVEIVGATAATYTPSVTQIGQVLTYEVTSVRAGYTTVIKTSPGKTILALAQTLQPVPTISGTPKVGTILTGDPGTWDAGTSLTYQWLADGTPIGGATSLTHGLTPAELGKVITFAVTSTQATYETVTTTSAPTGAVAVGDLTTTPVPTITGTSKVAVPLTAVPGAWDAGVTFTYQWTVDGSDVFGATDSTYTPVAADLGKVVTVKVTGSKTGYASTSRESDPTNAVAAGDQVATPKPTITGTPKVGLLLSGAPGTWDDGVTLTYQWTVAGNEVAGATGSSYTPVAEDAGQTVTVKVTGTRTGFSTVTKESDPTSAVANGTQGSTPTPTISGTPKVAVPLTVNSGPWDDGASLGYQWTVAGSEVAGATGVTYTPVPADVGEVVTVRVTGTRTGFDPVTQESDPTAAVALGDLTTTPTPALGGSAPKVGVTFTADPGTWDAGVTFGYQWTADGNDISGATSDTYTVAVSDLGTSIAVTVTGSKPGYASVTKTAPSSSPIEAGDLSTTPVPTITGTPQVGQLLTAVPGTWDEGVTLGYQWTADGSAVGGATTSTYTPVAGDLGKVVTVKVTGSRLGYADVTKESAPTSTVMSGGLVNTPTPTITGTPKVGQPLTALAGTWDSGVTLAYQWTVGGADIAGATSSGYTPAAADVGSVVTVKVTGSKAGFGSVTKESVATAAVTKGDLALTPVPTIGGTPQFSETLVARSGTWDTGTTLTYRWLADSVPVPGAVGADYLVRASDVGKSIVVVVTGAKAGYNSVNRTSVGTIAVAALALLDTECTVGLAGRARVGKTLTAQVGDCPPAATLHYAWYAGGKQILSARGATFTPRKKYAGKRIKVLVSISVPGYLGVLRASGPSGKVRP